MTREEWAIKIIKAECYVFNPLNLDRTQMVNTALDKAVEALEQEPRWIPVSDRLPEENMLCLVSVGKLYLTQTAIYSDLMGTIDKRIFYQGDYGHETFVNITQYVNAWMPLPKPYKAESEVQE